jgi:hypothetical protein
MMRRRAREPRLPVAVASERSHMSETTPAAVLIVANRTTSTPAMLAEVDRRAGTCSFGLMVPPDADHDWSEEDALRLVGRVARAEIAAVEPGDDAALTVHDLVDRGEYTEIILSTRPTHHAHWHRHKLPDRIQQLGVPVTVIPPEIDNWGPVEGFPADWTPHAANPAGMAGFGNY